MNIKKIWLAAFFVLAIFSIAMMDNSVAVCARDNNDQGNWVRVQDGQWWYRNSDGTHPSSSWKYINDNWYYFDANGWMKTGWVKYQSKWYYCKNNGAMESGWLLDGGKWYYLSGSGAMCTGWIKYQSKWYYCEKNGAMKTGWLLDGGKWYYLSGSGTMCTGWIKYQDKWYYCEKNGAMKSGWLLDRGKWYYLDKHGVLQTGPIDTAMVNLYLQKIEKENEKDGYEKMGNPKIVDHWWDNRFNLVYGVIYKKIVENKTEGYGGKVYYRIYRLDTGELYKEFEDQLK